MPGPLTLLVDNGSLEAAAPLALRALAEKLAEKIQLPVEPVSLLHSSGVPAGKLGGKSAEILEPALERRIAAGQDDFFILPLFFGPSAALTEYLPARLKHLQGKHAKFSARVAAPLFVAGDDRLALILADHIRAAGVKTPRIALVDHGSPARPVVAVRNQIAEQLGKLLGSDYVVAASSMERREGAEYDFGEPLLAGLLRQPGWNEGDVLVAMQFLLPGRHAGPNGDVAAICRAAEADSGGKLRTTMTALVAEHPLLIDILADRWQTTFSA
jgi:sirohydrochlorin ferrochelatase